MIHSLIFILVVLFLVRIFFYNKNSHNKLFQSHTTSFLNSIDQWQVLYLHHNPSHIHTIFLFYNNVVGIYRTAIYIYSISTGITLLINLAYCLYFK